MKVPVWLDREAPAKPSVSTEAPPDFAVQLIKEVDLTLERLPMVFTKLPMLSSTHTATTLLGRIRASG
ncbi:MAG: hypothetical protein A3J83_08650 [Elusimicrobia bacterium RIFOXYA2_FULL_40_6]|nr:MAG: hypothetical protein A3J83_08650 [Elusimicrobia bacterium RIFOXYA2_FULL_40_6]